MNSWNKSQLPISYSLIFDTLDFHLVFFHLYSHVKLAFIFNYWGSVRCW